MSSPGRFRVKLDRDTCSLCEVCAKRCPTGALTVSRSGTRLEIFFDPPSCHGCGAEFICQEVCPEKSIEVVRESEGPIPRGPVLLVRGEMLECPRCKALVAPQSKLLAVQQKQLLEMANKIKMSPT